jgi:hypothetical protein
MKNWRETMALLTIVATITVPSPPALAEDGDDDERFSLAVKDFGYAGGGAWQCAGNDERIGIEKQAMTAYNGLLRLFGTDEAFFFSAAFGAGTSASIDKAECGDFLKQFKDGMSKAGAQ